MHVLKKPTIIETVRFDRLRWFVHVQRMEGNRISRWICEQRDWEVDQEIDGKMRWERMEE